MHKNTQDKGVAIVYFRCIYWFDLLHRTTNIVKYWYGNCSRLYNHLLTEGGKQKCKKKKNPYL